MTIDTLAETATRVALLARQGAACERLQAALQDAGADVVLVSDPAQTDVASVRGAGAQAILIALEPAVEDALDRFDALLADPVITVIFDEAELAAKRDGWDAARWTRHLAAKLNRHQQVLPPGAETEAEPAVASPPMMDARQDAHADVAGSNADLLELEAMLEAASPLAEIHPHLEIDGADSGAVDPFDLLSLEAVLGAPSPDAPSGPEDDGDVATTFAGIELAEPERPREFDPNVRLQGASMFDPVLAEMETFAEPEAVLDFSGLSDLLLPASEAPADDANERGRFRRDLDDLHLRIADIQLENTRLPRTTSQGAVLVLAGIGGPDAVRQLLGELPATFPRPVLIQQRLEVGNHDKLVRQMQRATTMPVALAEPGLDILGGHVYMLPAGVGLSTASGGLTFRAAAGETMADALFLPLAPSESAVVLLSGSDAAAVDAAMNHAGNGALVAGQAADGCFDSSAASALVARGAETGTPAQLAQKLATRWPADPIHDSH